MLVAGLVALPLGAPVLRLSDIYLAIATIGFGEIVRIFWLNFDVLAAAVARTHGHPDRRGAGHQGHPEDHADLAPGAGAGRAAYSDVPPERARLGRAMSAIRQDETGAASVGINPVYVKTGRVHAQRHAGRGRGVSSAAT